MLEQVLRPVLVIVVGFALQWALNALGVALDEGTFVALVGAIVTYLLALLGVEGAARAGLLGKARKAKALAE